MSDSHSMDSKDGHGLDTAQADVLTAAYLEHGRAVRSRRVRIGVVAIAVLFACFAGVAAIMVLPLKRPGPVFEAKARVATGDPVSILPQEPEGTTVMVKQPDQEQADRPEPASAAPVATGSQVANGYSIDLGSAQSFTQLSRRFGEIARANQEIPFDTLEPRATLKDTAQGLEARLVVGPFPTEADARSACDQIALPAGVECRPAPFEGELISRQ
jgi:hypothetical protein